MVASCFVLDLCSLSPPLLRELKQCLLQLANLYAVSSPPSSRHQSDSLRDRIGLCYVLKNRISSTHELKIAYSPRGNFSLRDFHLAVNNLPEDYFLPEIDDSGALRTGDAKLSSVLSDQVLYSWGDKDIMRKVIVLSSCWYEKIDSSTKNILMDAADKCVSVEFVLFDQSAIHLSNMQENINCLARSLSDLDNCSFQTFLPDSRVFHSLVKRWLLELEDDREELLRARFVFKSSLVGSLNQISTSLSKAVGQIIDGFTSCQTCRCHGIVLDKATKNKVECPSCPITGHDLGTSDVIDNSVRVGDKTILFMPSFQSKMKLHQVSSPIEFNIIERTNLGSLSEGLIFGTSYLVAPSTCNEMETSSDEMHQSELNAQLFQGICSSLHSMDQGLVCSSYCNVETMRGTSFHCFYILQPSDNGPMLLKRLAGLEEFLPIPDINRFIGSSVSKDIDDSIQASLLEIELRDYNPVQHERGFHQKLNLLVKESLQFGVIRRILVSLRLQLGFCIFHDQHCQCLKVVEVFLIFACLHGHTRSIPSKQNEAISELNSNQPDPSEVVLQSDCVVDAIVVEDESPQLTLTTREDKSTSSIAEEWEQLVVIEAPKICSSPYISRPKTDVLFLSSPEINKELDIKTSRILERLEVPRKLKTKLTSPTVTGGSLTKPCLPTKRPLIPFQQPPYETDQSLTSSQLIKPNFQRIKRKIK